MPELPEVENIALGLRDVCRGGRVKSITVPNPIVLKGPCRSHWRKYLAHWQGTTLRAVTRRAKRLILANDKGQALVIQLGMTGKFLLGRSGRKPLRHTRMKICFENESEVHFVDTRRFGRIWLMPELDPANPDRVMRDAGMGPLGPDAPEITLSDFRACLGSTRPLKALLLDQSRIAGLGNIYVDESLFAAGLSPTRPAASLTDTEVQCLHKQIKAVLRRAIRAGGTTFSDYRNAYGDMGRFRARLKVYGRNGEPCKRCATPIRRLVVAGRGTHVCPQCQGGS